MKHAKCARRTARQPIRHTLRQRILSSALRGALLSLTVTAGLLPVTAAHAQQTDTREYAIPPGSLTETLNRFGAESGLLLSFSTTLTAGLHSPGLQGSHTAQAALQALLAGSGLEAVPRGNGYLLRKAEGGVQLAPVTVIDTYSREIARGPVPGYVALRSATGSKTDAALTRIPQSISVISAEQMADQGVQSITTALGYTPGVVGQYGDNDVRHDWLTVRGFTPARYLDGLRLPFGARGYAQPRIEPFGLERVEVLKGPASVLYGQAAPGGLVNMVRKRPTEEPTRELQLQLGSHERKQLALDLGGPVGDRDDVSYRVIGVVRDGKTAFDHVEERKHYFAPSLTLRPSDTTTLTLLAEYQKIDSPGGGGAPALPLNGTLKTGSHPRLPRSAFVGEPGYDHFRNEQQSIGYELEHALSERWTLRQNLRHMEVDTDSRRVQAFCASAASCDPSALLRYAWAFPETSKLFTVDNQAIATVETGRLRHTLLLGLDYSRERSAFEESQLTILGTPFNAYNPVYGTPVSRPAPGMLIDQRLSQIGLYAQDQIEVDALTITASGRYDRADTDTATHLATSGTTTRVEQKDRKFTGRLGASYAFDTGIHPYASYSTSFQPAGGTDRNGDAFDPTTGRQIEAGIKYQPTDSRSLLTLSVYRLTQQNVLTTDPANTSFRVQSGEVRMRGFELEGKFELSEQLTLIASYAHTDSEITKDNPTASGTSNQGKRLAFVPRHQASLWTNYRFGENLSGFSTGGGVRYIGQTWGNNANTTDVPGYTLADLALRYDFGKRDRSLKGLELALNVSNLFDKRYVSTCLSTTTSCYWGEGRKVTGTLGYRW